MAIWASHEPVYTDTHALRNNMARRSKVKKYKKKFEEVWNGRIATLAGMPVGEAALKVYKAAAREDVQETMAQLHGAAIPVWEAWVGWYPTWVDAEIRRVSKARVWSILDPDERRAAEYKRAADAKWRSRVVVMAEDVANEVARKSTWLACKRDVKKTLKVGNRAVPVFRDALTALRMAGALRVEGKVLELLVAPKHALRRLHDIDLATLVKS